MRKYLLLLFIIILLISCTSQKLIRTNNPSDITVPFLIHSLIDLGNLPPAPEGETNQADRAFVFSPSFQQAEPVKITGQIGELTQHLPLQYYFKRHAIGTDAAINSAIVRHVDFESKGRGGLDFKLERFYSSSLSFAQKGEIEVYKCLREFYVKYQEALKKMSWVRFDVDVGYSNQETHENILFGLYRNMFDYVVVMYCGSYPRDWSQIGREIDRAKSINELYDVATKYEVEYEGFVGRNGNHYHPITARIDQYGNLMIGPQTYNKKDGYDYVNPNPDALDPPMPTIAQHMKNTIDRFNQMREHVAQMISDLDAKITSHNQKESVIGDGWCLNLPYIIPPGDAAGRTGSIYFDGYRRKDFKADASNVPFVKEKGVLEIMMDSTLTVAGENASDLRYKFQTLERIHYFDNRGRLKYITDFTRNNAIKFRYNLTDSDLISEIVDAAGNTYTFLYQVVAGKQKLSSITSSYGKSQNYTVETWNVAAGTFVLKKVIDGKYETSYEYRNSAVMFESSEVTKRIRVPIIEKETNPLNGITNFKYYRLPVANYTAAIYDTDETYDIARKMLRYSMSKYPNSVERVYRDNDTSKVIVGHTTIDDTGEGLLVREKTTMSVYKDRLVEYKYRYNSGVWNLWRVMTSPMPILWEFEFDDTSFSMFVYQLSRLAQTNRPLKTEYYEYNSRNLIQKIITIFGYSPLEEWNVQGVRGLSQEFVYPPNNGGLNSLLAGVYGLPIEIIFRDYLYANQQLKKTTYEYTLDVVNARPLLKAIGGDAPRVSYGYFEKYYDFVEGRQKDKDPARSGRPTSTIESTENGSVSVCTHCWYTDYGNLKRVQNAQSHNIGYEYEASVGNDGTVLQEETFLSRIVRYPNNDFSQIGMGSTTHHNSIGQVVSFKDAEGSGGYNHTYDGYGRLKETNYLGGGRTVYEYFTSRESISKGLLTEDSTRVKNKVQAVPEEYYGTEILSDRNGRLIRVTKYIENSQTVVTKILYDDLSRVDRITGHHNRHQDFTYDALDRVIAAKDYLGGETKTKNDDIVKFRNINGRNLPLKKKTETDCLGYKRSFYYDVRDRLYFVEMEFKAYGWPSAKKIYWEYSWDSHDRLLWEKDPNNRVAHYVYDGFSRVIERHIYVCSGVPGSSPPPYNPANVNQHVREVFTYNNIHQLEYIYDRNDKPTRRLYDLWDRLIRIEKPEGDVTIFGRDNNGNITSRNDNGRTITYAYNEMSQVARVEDPEKNVTIFSFDLMGRNIYRTLKTAVGDLTSRWSYNSRNYLTSYIDERGSQWQWGYDGNGLSWSLEPRGEITRKTYTTDSAGAVVAVKNQRGDTTKYLRNKAGDIVMIEDCALGLAYERGFNVFGRVDYIKQPDGSVWRNYYDPVGRTIQSVSPEGRSDTVFYDPLGRINRRFKGNYWDDYIYNRDGNGNVISVWYNRIKIAAYTYDSLNRVKSYTPYIPAYGLLDAAKITYQYEDLGQKGTRVKITDANRKTSIIDKDANGRVVKTLTPIKVEYYGFRYRIELVDYFESGSVKRIRFYYGRENEAPPNNPAVVYTEEYAYYPNNRLESISYSDGSMVVFEYDPSGNQTKVTIKKNAADPGRSTKYKYSDVFNVPTEITGPDNHSRTIAYDSLGRPKKVYNGSLVKIYYDDIRRQVRYEQLSGRKYTNIFSSDGNLSEIIKPDRGRTSFGYDYANRVNHVTNTLQDEVRYTYGPSGAIATMSVKDRVSGVFLPRGRKTNYYPDGSVDTVVDVNGTTKYNYGLNQEVTSVQYGRGQTFNNPLKIKFRYYDDGSLRSTTYSNGVTKSYEYDPARNIVKITENKTTDGGQGTSQTVVKTVVYKRDGRGRIEEEYVDGQLSSTFGYEPEGVVSRINNIEYIYNPETGQLQTVKKVESNGTVSFYMNYEYYPNGWLKNRHTNEGYSQEYGYDPDGRVQSIKTRKDGTLKVGYAIKYDLNGNPEMVKVLKFFSSKKTTYKFNSENQLIAINPGTSANVIFKYDESGNLVDEITAFGNRIHRTYNWSNQLTQMDINDTWARGCVFDLRGNLIGILDMAGQQLVSFDFDCAHRLVRIRQKPLAAEERVIEEFDYDATDRLRVDHDVKNNRTYCLEHAGVFPTLLKGDSGDSDVGEIVPEPSNFHPLGSVGSAGVLIPNWLFGVGCEVYNPQGNEVGNLVGDPYGNLESGNIELNPFWYKGYYRTWGEGISGLDWAGTRFYNPNMRQFISPDLLQGDPSRPISMNRNRSFSGNPLMMTDILGLKDISIAAFWRKYEEGPGSAYNSEQPDMSGVNDLMAYQAIMHAGQEAVPLGVDLSGWYQTMNFLPNIEQGKIFTRYEGSAWEIEQSNPSGKNQSDIPFAIPHESNVEDATVDIERNNPFEQGQPFFDLSEYRQASKLPTVSSATKTEKQEDLAYHRQAKFNIFFGGTTKLFGAGIDLRGGLKFNSDYLEVYGGCQPPGVVGLEFRVYRNRDRSFYRGKINLGPFSYEKVFLKLKLEDVYTSEKVKIGFTPVSVRHGFLGMSFGGKVEYAFIMPESVMKSSSDRFGVTFYPMIYEIPIFTDDYIPLSGNVPISNVRQTNQWIPYDGGAWGIVY